MFGHRSASKVKADVSSTTKGHLGRGASYMLLLLTGTLLAYSRPEASTSNYQRALTFAERVAYQRIIEDVYWRHRIWPKENPNPKPSLDAVMSQAQLEKKVTDYLRKSQALEDYWKKPITPEQLQAEMHRMAKHTKKPEVLRELFESLGNDPFVIAECLARPLLAERLFQSKSQGSPKTNEEAIQSGNLHNALTTLISYTLPVIGNTSDPDGECTDDTWTSTTITNAPDARYSHKAVWTGTEMIIWGGDAFPTTFNTGGRYNPSTDSWTPTSTVNAPDPRIAHTLIWTGTEIIVWGGLNFYPIVYLNTGGRYNPITDSWTSTSTTGAPAVRSSHSAVWTGTEMIVWGGFDGGSIPYKSGGRYNPITNTWTDTNRRNAPPGRVEFTAVWTGREMIIWGGYDIFNRLATGGRYNPITDTWAATSRTDAPSPRSFNTAVWTGSEMIIWGGSDGFTDFDDGGRYNPITNTWMATSTINAPEARSVHTGVWTGDEMIVWGGDFYDGSHHYLNTGGRYNPLNDSWLATSTANAPAARNAQTAVWTGGEMIVWGGYNGIFLNTGGRYCAQPGAQSPTPTPTGTPTATVTPTSSPTPSCTGCSVTSPICDTTVFFPQTDFVIHLQPPGPAALEASDFTVNGIPADSFMIVSGGAEVHFYFNASPAMPGENKIHVAACAFICGSGFVPEFTCMFIYVPNTPTPTPTTTLTPSASPTPSDTYPPSPTPSATSTATGTPTPNPRPTPAPRVRPTPAPRP